MNEQFNSKNILLDHNKLISELYINSSGKKYYFKPEVFNYERREDKIDRTQKTNSKKRKRKKPNSVDVELLKTDSSISYQHELEIDHLKNAIEVYKQNNNLKCAYDIETRNNTVFLSNEQKVYNTTETRFEEIVNIPSKFLKFHGSNYTEYIQKIVRDNETFLIPPKSYFYNSNVNDIKTIKFKEKFDFIVMDPPWRNKFIRRLKKSSYKYNSAYEMLSNDNIQEIPIQDLIHENSLVAIWCTNSRQSQEAILNKFCPNWNLKPLAKVFWIKVSTNGNTVCDINDEFGKKQPYETLYIATSIKNTSKGLEKLKEMNGYCIFSIPSLIHSHKPPILQIFKEFLSKDNSEELICLEIFARYLQPNFTSIGLEVLKLMDERFYNLEN